jgi:hypothetical protein
LEHSVVQKKVQEWSEAINEEVRFAANCVGVAVTINDRLEKIEWYGRSGLFQSLWPGLLRAAILEAVLENGRPAQPSQLDETRFADPEPAHAVSA